MLGASAPILRPSFRFGVQGFGFWVQAYLHTVLGLGLRGPSFAFNIVVAVAASVAAALAAAAVAVTVALAGPSKAESLGHCVLNFCIWSTLDAIACKPARVTSVGL